MFCSFLTGTIPWHGSSNIGHLEAVVHILQQPFVKGVSRVCKPVSLSFLENGGQNTKKSVHVDIVCTLNGNPVWVLVSARNPKFVSWNRGSCGNQNNNKGLRTRILQVVDAAAHSLPSTRPYSIILFFSNGLDQSIRANLEREFGASEFGIEFPVSDFGFSEELEDEWIYIHKRSFGLSVCILEIKVDQSRNCSVPTIECRFKDPLLGAVSTREGDLQEECIGLTLGGSFCSLISRMKPPLLDLKDTEFAREKGISGEGDMINFDTTALIALVSGISNGATEKILSTSERELRLRFKSNYEFVITQVYIPVFIYVHCTICLYLEALRATSRVITYIFGRLCVIVYASQISGVLDLKILYASVSVYMATFSDNFYLIFPPTLFDIGEAQVKFQVKFTPPKK